MSDTGVQAAEAAQPQAPEGAQEGANTEQQAQTPEAPKAPEAGAPQEGEQPKEDMTSLPDWARGLIHALREENAARRVSEKASRDALAQAKTPEEFAKAVEDMTTANKALERKLLIAIEAADIPETFHKLLEGDTAEAIKASAEKIRPMLKLAGGEREMADPNVDPSGGLNPKASEGTASEDPTAIAKRIRSHLRR